jgi:glycosyltransferase involved in cell wall biosynthesis
MVGDGPLKKDVEEMIKTHGMEDRFLLPGWVDPAVVRKYMEKSDILFMPSLSEGLPVVGVQSLAAGLAIVATNVGGFSDIVKDGFNGSLVEPSKPGELGDALESLLTDPLKLASSRKASLKFANQFDIRRVADQYEAVFSTLLPV